jgi:hypothetical protein
MHNDDAIGIGDFLAMPFYFLRNRAGLGDFACWENWIEPFRVQIVKRDLVAILSQFGNSGLRNGVIEALRGWMS